MAILVILSDSEIFIFYCYRFCSRKNGFFVGLLAVQKMIYFVEIFLFLLALMFILMYTQL